VRIFELSQLAGISIPTIKYYLREGLLPPGVSTAPNQAHYDEHHVERLALIRALREGGGLSISTLTRVFAAMDRYQAGTRPEYLSIAVGELTDPLHVPADEADEYDRAHREVDQLVAQLSWDTDEDSPGHDDLIRALVGIHRHLPGLIRGPDQLRPYADAMRSLANIEINDSYEPDTDPNATLRFSVLGTVLFEPLLLALRKLAHVDRIRRLATRDATTGNLA
jgi:DNA-binding transcriptional MerR regulator